MKPNTKYKRSDGKEYFMCPFTKMYITQGSNEWSHINCMAVDVTNGDLSRAPFYAPSTSKVIQIFPENGQAILETVGTVIIANGKEAKVKYCYAHNNSLNLKVGQVINQGDLLGYMGSLMGNNKNGCGVHCHFQVGVNATAWGVKKGYFTYNGVVFGVYGFDKEPYDFEDVCFMNDTQILSGKAEWKYIPSTGWKYIDNEWYFYDAKGKLTYNDWKKIGGKWYYFTPSGSLYYGWIEWNDKKYYTDGKGVMVTGNYRIEGTDYKFRSDGSLIE